MFRGVQLLHEEVEVMNVGGFINLRGYTSTSKSLGVARGFALNDLPVNREPVVYHIFFKGDEGLFYLSNDFSAYQEREVLI